MDDVLCTVVLGVLVCVVSCQDVQPKTHNWKVVIRTSIEDRSVFKVDPGTHNKVELEMIGDKGTSGKLMVTKSLKTGKNQTVMFENVKDVGELKKLRVKLLGNDAWWLHSISLTNMETWREYTFLFNSLLDGNRPGTPDEVVIPKQGQRVRIQPTTLKSSSENCAGVTCQHGGTCVDVGGNFRCDCLPGYVGRYCGSSCQDTTCVPAQPAYINGNWGRWAAWSDCSVTCGAGTKTRTRKCDNPPPAHGGKSCSGHATDKDDCDEGSCPIPTPTLIMSTTGDIPPGSEVTFTCNASTSWGDTNKYLYKFILQKPEESSPTVLQTFSTSDIYKVDNFQIGDVGIYRCILMDVAESAMPIASEQVMPVLDQCYPNPCKNDGVCVSRCLGIFYCECKPSFLGRWCQKELDPAIQKPDRPPAEDPYYTNRTLTYLESFAVTVIPVSSFGVIIFLCCDGMAWFSRSRIKSRDPQEYERMMRRRKRKPYLNMTKRFLKVVKSTTSVDVGTEILNSVLPHKHLVLVPSKRSTGNLKTSTRRIPYPTVAESKETELTARRRRRKSMPIGSPIHPSTKARVRFELTSASSMSTVMMNADNQGTEDGETKTSHIGTSIEKQTSTINNRPKTKNTDMINDLLMTHGLKDTKKKTVVKKYHAVGKTCSKANKPRHVSYERNCQKMADSSDEECNRILSVREICVALLWDVPVHSIEETNEEEIHDLP